MIWLLLYFYIGVAIGAFVGVKNKDNFVMSEIIICLVMACFWPVVFGNILAKISDHFDEKEKN